MTDNKSIMTAIKRAVSPHPQKANASIIATSPCTTPIVSRTPLTDFICTRLRGEKLQLFGVMFAEAIKNDRHARIILFENVYKFLGYDHYKHAVRQLKRLFPDIQSVSGNLPSSGLVSKNTPGPSKDSYLISARQFDTMLSEAKTAEGVLARDMMLDVKDAVQDYIKWEMEASAKIAQQQLEEQKAQARLQLEESNAERQELQAVQAKLQATIESQKKREEKKEARKRQQKEPMETAYIMTNMPDDNQGPYKCGKTGGDAKKRAKEMQTGNHEEMRVVASAKCVDSKLVEDVMHRIFRDYRTNDRLEWFDTNLKSLNCVLQFVVKVIDGLNCVDHDAICIEEALRKVTAFMEETVFSTSGQAEASEEDTTVSNIRPSVPAAEPEPKPVDLAAQWTSDETDPYSYFIDIALERNGHENDFFTTKDALKVWRALSRHKRHKNIMSNVPRERDLVAQIRQQIPRSQYFVNAVVHDGEESQLIGGVFKGCSLRFIADGRQIIQRPQANATSIEDPIEEWIQDKYERTADDQVRLGAREAFLRFKDDTKWDISENDFSFGMRDCGLKETRLTCGNIYKGLRRRR